MDKLDFQRMDAQFHGLMLPVGLRIDRFTVSSGAAHMSWPPFAITTEAAARAAVVVTEGSVAEFLEVKTPDNLKRFKVHCDKGKVVCEAVANLIVDIPVKAVCTLRIEDQSKVFVDVESVDVIGGGAKKLVENQLAKINPILDASSFPIQVKLDNVEVDGGEIVVTGTIAP